MQNNYEHIPQEKFRFVQRDANLHDKKLETKARGFFADALLRFKKNKSSVVAAWIICILVLYALIVPVVSPYSINDKDIIYTTRAPFVRSIADKKLGILDGGTNLASQNQKQYERLEAIGIETGMNPIIEVTGESYYEEMYRGSMKKFKSYSLRINKYYDTGVIYRVFSNEDFIKIMEWQNESGIQVIYPYVDYDNAADKNSNVWFEVDSKGNAKRDANGNFIPNYSTNVAGAGVEYNSIRIKGDDGSYAYSAQKQGGAVECRICYYNYYTYVNGHEPMYLFGTTTMGQDMFTAIGVGARFSLIFAVIVSAINLTIGAVYGSIQGYYGGTVDLILDRISDILSGVPFIVVATLFQLHLAQKLGVIPSFLFAFVLTGWIGMAALTRKQFYRFKNQEFVHAARTLGASDRRLMFKHIFPNSMGTIITSCALIIPGVVSSETSLTYLGIINLSDVAGTTVGVLMQQGQTTMTSSPHAMFFPAIFFSLLMITFNLFGNGLRDAFNPSTRGVED